jgi:predicted O-methyltransferase YrrM
MNSHPETFLRIHELGSIIPPYRPNFDFPGLFIDKSQQDIAKYRLRKGILIQIRNRPLFGKMIRGYLRREDALKLYEMAYFTCGDILELGPFHGLSTSILARANRNSAHPRHIYSVDLDPSCVKSTSLNLRSLGLDKHVIVTCEDAVAAIRRFISEDQHFGFVFVDHSHAYEPVYDVCRLLGRVIVAGGFCQFHDFNDARNSNPNNKDYGVYQAVVDGLEKSDFEFYGIYGCTALYRAIEH